MQKVLGSLGGKGFRLLGLVAYYKYLKKKKNVVTKKLYAHYTFGSLTCRIWFRFLWEAKLHVCNYNIKFLGFSTMIVIIIAEG